LPLKGFKIVRIEEGKGGIRREGRQRERECVLKGRETWCLIVDGSDAQKILSFLRWR
jgi:hypothetical protein